MKRKLFHVSGLLIILVTLFFALNVNINAQRRVVVVKDHNRDYREVIVKDRHYFYRGGNFYDRGPRGYVRIEAPIGARITVLPRGYEIIKIRRDRYFVFDNIYYKYLPRERVYVVVERPL